MAHTNRVLVVDDDKNICELLQIYLQNAGFETDACYSAKTALDQYDSQAYDLVLLDIMLPDVAGFDLCRAMKQKKDIPIIMLTARDMLVDKIQGFSCGADDYIVKPFEPAEVIVRIHARLKKPKPQDVLPDIITIGNISMNISAYEVKKDGQTVDLKPREFQLLHFFLTNRNIVFTRDTLLQKVWNYDIAGDTRTVDVHIKTLRKKLLDENSTFDIKTVWGVGYKLEGE